MEVHQGGIYLYEPPTISTPDQAALVTTSGSEQSGLRPYVIVSCDIVNAGKPTAVGVPLSTRTHKANSYRIMLPMAELIRGYDATEDFRHSVALCDHVRVLDISRIRKRIGTVSQNALNSVIGVGLAFVFDMR
jgi:mRNA-degrading endonuclease toxin of MazEF toxin-antitoxin module